VELLLVEDDGAARDATQFLLEQHGATVRSVDSAERAYAALAGWRPDAIIADIGVPGEDGYVLLKTLRRSEKLQGLARIPAIAVTAFARLADRERALAWVLTTTWPSPSTRRSSLPCFIVDRLG
jgi:CheY-like chemotaxis protein